VQSSTTNHARPRAIRVYLEGLPPLSPTLSLLLATLSREDASFAKISDLIEKDPVLAGNVLGLVNSSLYERRERVSSVRHAVSLLGVNKLRNAALSMSITRMWNKMHTPLSWSMRKFNRHAMAVATLADLLAQEAPISYPEGAFVAGLLHDLGKLMIAVCLAPEYEAIEQFMAKTSRPRIECEAEILGTTHSDLSGEAMHEWKMPGPIEAAVRYHHNPGMDPSVGDPNIISLSRAIATADHYVNEIGYGVGDSPPLPEPSGTLLIADLGISDVQRVLDFFHAEFESISSFF
jgi:HD-like signal output (HDOD) protein